MTAEEYLKMKREEERLQRETDRAHGAIDHLQTRLKEEFGIATEVEGRALLKQLERKLAELERKADAALAEYRKKFKNNADERE